MMEGGQVNYESSEDENIPEDEDAFQKQSRKTIQASVSKKDPLIIRHQMEDIRRDSKNQRDVYDSLAKEEEDKKLL
jgi:hypothetical protein